MLILWIKGSQEIVIVYTKARERGIFLLIGWNRIYETITDGYRITETNIIVIDNCNLSEGGKCKMKNDKFCYDQIANKRTNKQLKRGTCAGCDKTAGETTSRGNVKGSAFNGSVIISAFILQYSQLSECSNCILLSAPNHECVDIFRAKWENIHRQTPPAHIDNKQMIEVAKKCLHIFHFHWLPELNRIHVS